PHTFADNIPAMKRYLTSALLLALLAFGCKKTDSLDEQPSSDKALISFSFTPNVNGQNRQLAEVAKGTLSGNNVSVSLPDGLDLSDLLAEVEVSPRATVSINGQIQVEWFQGMWGVQTDFSAPVTIRVTAEDGSSTDYVVTAT